MEDAYVVKESSPRRNNNNSSRRGTRKASTVEEMNRRASRILEMTNKIEMSKQHFQQYQQHQLSPNPSPPHQHLKQQQQQQQQQIQNQQQQQKDNFQMPIMRKQSLAVNFHVPSKLLSSMGITAGMMCYICCMYNGF